MSQPRPPRWVVRIAADADRDTLEAAAGQPFVPALRTALVVAAGPDGRSHVRWAPDAVEHLVPSATLST